MLESSLSIPEITDVEQREAYEQWRLLYHDFAAHPYVTSESARLRNELKANISLAESQNYTEITILGFLYGSVARGMAYHGSDTDWVCVRDGCMDYQTEKSLVGNEFTYNLRFFPDRPQFIRVFDAPESIYTNASLPFFPAVGEFENDEYGKKIQPILYRLRKQVLQAISRSQMHINGHEPLEIWQQIQRSLNLHFLPNLTDRVVEYGSNKNRTDTIKAFRSSTIANHGPEAADYFNMLDTMSVPDWDFMKRAFGID
ncbi:hypothetical protein KBD81_01360 [Candidatus Woesebacteria bacterium]|nr:hypothetical protein [Candidatus Woesebacteria bacterium]